MAVVQNLVLPTGFVNYVNDPAIGLSAIPPFPGFGDQYQGQLGKRFEFDDENVRWYAANGAGYGGEFQYVLLAASDAASPVVGQQLFWDSSVAPSYYQVTGDETKNSADDAVLKAGICLTPNVTPGNYTLIQTRGLIYLKFRAALTVAGAVGCGVWTAGAGAGADNGLFDVIQSASATDFAQVSLMQRRFVGTAYEAPTNGGLKRVYYDYRLSLI